jgi:hypothetical protein
MIKKPNRKPDLDTESMSLWKVDKEEFDKEDGIKIKYKDIELELIGFKYVRNRKNEVVFAWKIKHDKKIVLYSTIKECKETKELEKLLKAFAYTYRYELQNSMDTLKNLYSQKGSIEKLDGKRS